MLTANSLFRRRGWGRLGWQIEVLGVSREGGSLIMSNRNERNLHPAVKKEKDQCLVEAYKHDHWCYTQFVDWIKQIACVICLRIAIWVLLFQYRNIRCSQRSFSSQALTSRYTSARLLWNYLTSKSIEPVKNVPSQLNGSDENLEVAWCFYSGCERLHGFSYRPLSSGFEDLTQPRWSTEEREAIREYH